MSKPRVYVAGPITGLPNGNKEEFEAAVKWLRERTSFEVISPLEMDSSEEFAATMANHYGEVYWHRMVEDFKTVISVDALVLLNGWARSKGARIEVFVALSLGKRFYEWSSAQGGGYLTSLHPSVVREAIQENMP
jgi:hypothetical protein